ncbi:TetR/AcrR family transcriptional regulator [Nocardiopsis potens]|uniref:TetR/AcrR family transcriptional regulator n=1 Tax=Nocardiopsis potens TaxID=1246458 RepID=UPI0003466104|nr:TetR/AcrR family transcriptional regulator [Nocardiopsis potens]
MPRQVDHRQRRAQITDAVLRIAARRGLGDVTMSEVAAEAGVSKGRVQHYFGSKERLLLHTGHRLRDRVGARLLPESPGDGALPALTRLLHAVLPTAEEARVDALAGKALFSVALGMPELSEEYRRGTADLRGLLADLLVKAGGGAEDADRHAAALLGLTEYLSDALLLEETTAPEARRRLDAQIAEFLGR